MVDSNEAVSYLYGSESAELLRLRLVANELGGLSGTPPPLRR